MLIWPPSATGDITAVKIIVYICQHHALHDLNLIHKYAYPHVH